MLIIFQKTRDIKINKKSLPRILNNFKANFKNIRQVSNKNYYILHKSYYHFLFFLKTKPEMYTNKIIEELKQFYILEFLEIIFKYIRQVYNKSYHILQKNLLL